MNISTCDLIQQCVNEADASAASNRRLHKRVPFFRAIKITAEDAEQDELTAFSRDISPSGIGLLHRSALSEGLTNIGISTPNGGQFDLTCDVQWCTPVRDDWHFSGARFTELSMRHAAGLLSAVFRESIRRRLRERHPFFRPVTVKNAQGPGSQVSAFSRDISSEGIGLLHNEPVERCRTILEIPTSQGTLEVSTEIRWSQPVGDGWYLSGGRFATITLDELPSRLV